VILITGASGTVGKTVLAEMVRTGAKCKAMYRSQAETAKAPAGAATAIGDFTNRETLTAALNGVDSVYLVCSPIPDLVQLENNMIDSCASAGVKHVVLNSALGAGDYPKSFPSWHRQVENKLKSTPLTYTILRPNSFHQNVLAFFAPSIRAEGAFYSSMGHARVSFIDVRDIAVVAAKALTSSGHAGKTYELNGPEALTYGQLAEKIAKQSGRPTKYVDIPVEAQRKAMLDQGMPVWQVDALLDLQAYYASGKGSSTDGLLQQLLGRAPITMDRFLSEFASEFRTQAARA
jgi:uncharacterized protein YbjT (DUF2867 family)